MVTTDFDTWISANVETLEDAFCVKQCIENVENIGSYDIKTNGDKKFITAFDETLMIASEKSQETFLNMLEDRFSDGELDIETLYEFNRQMEKDD